MAYNVCEERLWVKGSEQINCDLKVNRDIYTDKIESNCAINKGDMDVQGELTVRSDVSISGDLYVNGTEYVNNTETSQTTDNYLVLRYNKSTALGNDEYSGIAVHNYSIDKTATLTADKNGIWRIADNSENPIDYTDISYYDGVYYASLSTTSIAVINGIKTSFDSDEFDNCVIYNGTYYYYDNVNWWSLSLVDGKLTKSASPISDSGLISTLESLTKADLVYFRILSITVISEIQNQPLLTREETSNLDNNHLLKWDNTNERAIDSNVSAVTNSGVTCVSTDYFCGNLCGIANNSTCFNGCTYACACDDIRNGLTSCVGTVTSVKVYCDSTCVNEITSCGDICLGCNAFNSTAFTTCVGTVTILNKASVNEDTPIVLCTDTTSVGVSSACSLTFNTSTGLLSATAFCGGICGSINSACCSCMVYLDCYTGNCDRPIMVTSGRGTNGYSDQGVVTSGCDFTYNPATGLLNATKVKIGKCPTIQYNSTSQAIEFVF